MPGDADPHVGGDLVDSLLDLVPRRDPDRSGVLVVEIDAEDVALVQVVVQVGAVRLVVLADGVPDVLGLGDVEPVDPAVVLEPYTGDSEKA